MIMITICRQLRLPRPVVARTQGRAPAQAMLGWADRWPTPERERRRSFSALLTQQLQVENLTGEASVGARALAIGVAYSLARSEMPIPAVGLVVPRSLEHRRHAPYPPQITFEPISGPWAPNQYIQEVLLLQLGQMGVSVLEILAEGSGRRTPR